MNVLDSLIDMADLRYDGFDPSMSVFNADLAPARRYVHTYTQAVDYDRSVNDEHGHLVPAPSSFAGEP